MYPRLALERAGLLSAEITGLYHHAQLICDFVLATVIPVWEAMWQLPPCLTAFLGSSRMCTLHKPGGQVRVGFVVVGVWLDCLACCALALTPDQGRQGE
jgi:hypothetical protein